MLGIMWFILELQPLVKGGMPVIYNTLDIYKCQKFERVLVDRLA